MKKLTVYWDEVLSYSSHIYAPDDLSPEEEFQFVKDNFHVCYEKMEGPHDGELITESIEVFYND